MRTRYTLNALIRLIALASLVAIAAPLHGQNFYWEGNSNNINAASNWRSNDKPSFSNQNAIWTFEGAYTSPYIGADNLDMAGYYFRGNSGAYNIGANRDYDIFGFSVSGTTYAIFNDTALSQTISNSSGGGIKFFGTELNIATGTGKVIINSRTDFNGSNQTNIIGAGSFELIGDANINSKNFTFSNSGVNDIRNNFNSSNQLILNGGSTTTFHGQVTNTTSTTVSNNTVVHFDSTFNSNKLTIESGAKVYMGGNATHNSGIDLKCGTLLLKKSNAIGNYQLNAMGGIFNLQGYSEGLNGLSLTKNSTIDFGSAAGANSLNFNNTGSFTAGTYLTVLNWQSGDTLQINNMNGKQSQVLFYGNYGSGLGFYNANYGGNILTPGALSMIDPGLINCVPVPVPVPEPGTYLMGGALLIALVTFEWRRRRKNQKSSPIVGA